MGHTLDHAINGCRCERSAMLACVICGKTLKDGSHSDTCGERCFRQLLKLQRGTPFEQPAST